MHIFRNDGLWHCVFCLNGCEMLCTNDSPVKAYRAALLMRTVLEHILVRGSR